MHLPNIKRDIVIIAQNKPEAKIVNVDLKIASTLSLGMSVERVWRRTTGHYSAHVRSSNSKKTNTSS